MAEREYSKYQQKVIGRYYENREAIDQQRLEELVTSLYLATGAKKIDKMWESARDLMTRLGTPESRVTHVCEKRDPAILAEVVKDIQTGKIVPKSK